MGVPLVKVIEFVVGDRARSIAAQLLDTAGDPVDLTGNTVKLRLVSVADESLKVEAAATIDDATQGMVSYAWQTADVDTAGDYWCWWIRTDATGREEHFPGGRARLQVSFVRQL